MSDRLIVAAVCRHSCITGWETWLTDRVKSDTKAHYIAHIRTLVPKRKYLAAAQSFATYLVRISVLPSNVARGVDGPPQNKPRAVEIPLADVRRIVDGADGPYRGLFALLYGTGIEISAALTCIETDVDTQRREVRARGTKAHTRDRVIRVAEWAWPYVEAPLETVMPGERCSVDLIGKRPAMHRARLVAFASRDVQMVATRYGRYAPRSDERDRWEKIAAQLDEPAPIASDISENLAKLGAVLGAPSRNDSSQPQLSDWLADSRGGTRTHDPGIMSAVL